MAIKAKTINTIVIGGSVAMGKSTLAKKLGFTYVEELDNNDDFQQLLLKQMLEGSEIAKPLFQLHLMIQRHINYKRKVLDNKVCVFDRSILEDKIFAKEHLEKFPEVFKYYLSFWNKNVEEMKKEIGMPKLYILLTCSWEVFKERIFKRNRDVEINTWNKNRSMFKKMHFEYIPYMEKVLTKLSIEYYVLDTTNMSILEVVKNVKNKLRDYGISAK